MTLAQHVEGEALLSCCGICLGLIFFIFWLIQFFDLMSRSDEAFPSRYDKIIWSAVLILLNLLGALIYWFWKQGNTARSLAEQDVKESLKQAGLEIKDKDDSGTA